MNYRKPNVPPTASAVPVTKPYNPKELYKLYEPYELYEPNSMQFKETDTVELKRIYNETIEKELVAFLNTQGGILYIGVEDDGSVVGVDNLDETMVRISETISTKILPNPQEFIELGTKYINGKYVVEISIKKGNSLYYIKKYGRSSAGCFVRVGTTCRGLSEEQIEKRQINLLSAKIQITDIASKKKTLSFDYLKILFKDNNLTLNNATFEENLSLRTVGGQYNLMAELLADKNDVSIKVVRFAGKTKSSGIIKRNEYGFKCLITAMKQAFDYCADVINETRTVFGDNGIRKDISLFNKAAFREVWFNACLHNNWQDGTPPAIYVFSDHLEVISTGGLPHNLSKEDFFAGISKPVNEKLATIYTQLGLIEQTGFGNPFVIEKYGRAIFEFLDFFIRVRIPFEFELEEENVGGGGNDVGDSAANVGEDDGNNSDDDGDSAVNVGEDDGINSDDVGDSAVTVGEDDGNNSDDVGDSAVNDGEDDGNNSDDVGDSAVTVGEDDGNNSGDVGDSAVTVGEDDGNNSDDVGEDESVNVVKIIVELIQENPRVSIKEISLQIMKSQRQAERIMATLKSKGIVERTGAAHGGIWHIPPQK